MPTESVDDFDELFPGALEAAGEVFPGPPPGLVERGIARGRSMRRARAARQAAVAASLAAVVAGGAVAGTHLFAGTAAQTTDTATTPPPKPSASADPSATPTLSDQWMISTLEGLLPAGGTFTDTLGRGTAALHGPGSSAPYASVVYHNGHGGASGIEIG